MAVKLTLGNRFVQVSGANLKTTRAIEKECSYKVEGYFFSPAYKARRWDGCEHLFKYSKGLGYYAPAGLAQDIAELLKERGLKYEVEFTTKIKHERRELKWNKDKVLRDYQKEAIKAILGKPISGRGVIKMPIRSGKTLTAARIIWNYGRPALFVVPSKSLLYQTIRGLQEALPDAEIGQVGDGVYDPKFITVATIQTLGTMAPKKKKGDREAQEAHPDYKRLINFFDLVFFDECFVAGTLIDGKPIETIKVGDYVSSFDEHMNVTKKRVTHIFKNKAPNKLLKVTTEDGRSVICTSGHPFRTPYGWLLAHMLDTSHVVHTITCDDKENKVSCVQNEDRHRQMGMESDGPLQENGKSVLLDKLRSKIHGKYYVSKSSPKVQENASGFFEENEEVKSNDERNCQREDEDHASRHWASTENSWWKWATNARSRLGARVNAWMGDRTRDRNGGRSYQARLGEELQSGHCERETKDRDRSGRALSRSEEEASSRSKERACVGSSRVASVEVYEQGSDGRFEEVCPDGFVYNLEVEETETYVANDFAVHNCHHIRGTGEWYRVFMEINARFKIGLSATVFFESRREQERGIIWLRASCGPVRIDIPAGRLIRDGYLLPQHVKMYKCLLPLTKSSSRWSATLKKQCITQNVHRNKMLASLVKEHAPMKTIVIAKELSHIAALCEELDKLGVAHDTIVGKDKQSARDKKVEGLVNGEYNVLVGNVVGEGIDIPAVECVVNAEGGRDEKATWQRQRNLTVNEDSDKKPPIMIDVYDKMNPYFEKHSKARLKTYKSESEFKVEVLNHEEKQMKLFGS